MGIIGGLLGALFTVINARISLFRRTHIVKHRHRRIIDVLTWCFIVSSIAYVLPFAFGCTQKNDPTTNSLPKQMLRWTCPEDTVCLSFKGPSTQSYLER
jgi:H+/Cl- antiporter ClcA